MTFSLVLCKVFLHILNIKNSDQAPTWRSCKVSMLPSPLVSHFVNASFDQSMKKYFQVTAIGWSP